ncbi:MAG TPA: glycosyltransferase family 39 protein [Bacteroidales bacterium]|nr:glycosyltransferase family 39 protein [Bacteroidales bacterium]
MEILTLRKDIVKKNNWLHNTINRRPDYFLLGGVLFFCFFYRLYYFKFINPDIFYNSDSVSYFAPINIFNGNIDLYRTPVYPYIIKFFKCISSEHFIQYLVLFQQALSFFSIIPFYYISKKILKNKYLVILTVLFYGCYSFIIIQNININPESLCIIGSVLILFLFVRYIEKPTKHTAFLLGLFPFILIMLKPTYVIVMLIFFIFLILRYLFFRKEKKELCWGLLGWFIAVIGVLSYCEMNKIYNGEFVLSKVELNNSLSNIITSETYKQGGDKELINLIDTTKQNGVYVSVFLLNNGCIDNYLCSNENFPQYLKPTKDMNFCLSIPNTVNYSPERINKFVKKSQYTFPYLKYLIRRFLNTFLDYKVLFSIIILELIFLLIAYFKNKKILWSLFFCILFVSAQFATIIIVIGQFSLNAYAPIEAVNRLLLPSYPFIILIVAYFIYILISSIDLNKMIKMINDTYE